MTRAIQLMLARQKLNRLFLKGATLMTSENEFMDIIDELYSVAEKYGGSMDELSSSTQSTAKPSFCTQAKYIHRGCYCPSPVIDLLIGNTKRGKATEKLPKTKKEYFKYCLDMNGRIFSAEKHIPEISENSPVEIEFIIMENDIEYGITFNAAPPNRIIHLSRACYENTLIKSYSAMVYYEGIPKDKMTLHHEEYMYSGTLLTKADIYFNIAPDINIYDLHECYFKYDNSVKIYEYDVVRQFQGKPTLATFSVPKVKYNQRLL